MMGLFLVGLALLIALALCFVLPPLLRRRGSAVPTPPADGAREANLRVLREQRAALEAERLSGAVDEAQYQTALAELQRRALEEEDAAQAQHQAAAPGGARAGRTALVVGVLLPFFALLGYALLGAPQALLQNPAGATAQGEFTQAQVEEMVAKLAQRMESKTTSEAADLPGWVMLARSYALMQRYEQAARAYVRARALAPQDAQLMADHADVMAMVQGQRVSGEPQQLAERALQVDPNNLKALALVGSAAFERQDYAGALQRWEQALRLAPPGSEFAQGLEGGVRDARAALAGKPGGAGAAAAATTTANATPAPAGAGASAAAAPAARVSGTVRVAPALAAKVAPGDTVFVFARAPEGPRMPLAILRAEAGGLPLKFTLDAASAMSPELNLSKFDKVVVGARITKSGNAMPQSGDLIGQIGPVATGSSDLVLTIDAVQP